MSKPLSKAERDAIIASIKQGKKLHQEAHLDKALDWSNKNPENKPHFIINEGNHVIIY